MGFWTNIRESFAWARGAILGLRPADDGMPVAAKAGSQGGVVVEGIVGGTAIPVSMAATPTGAATETTAASTLALAGTIRNATTPSRADTATGRLEVDKRGGAFANLAASHSRILQLEVEGATTIVGSGTLYEGPCDGLSCETDDVYVFCVLREMQDFVPPAASWTAGAGWALKAGTTTVFEHTAGSTATLSFTVQTLSDTVQPLLVGVPYAVKFNSASRTAGDVTLAIGNASGSARSTDGNYIECLQSSSGVTFQFTPHTDYDGEIDVSQIRIGVPVYLKSAGTIFPASATRVLGTATKAAGATLVASPATHVVRAHWYRRPGAVEVV